ncbi:hypothetical protein CV_2254 [Chromobacterium violaceum ATCC 12472]|uniref:Uncharacterized protein n=1 Tax=Chromobacterium violaceum (strain ATCC 12472 / DSM 30191 / JCM 1249 / CCUG 213 / NBRC 12614 / NCIMB 9131 / NCTC 9757 / MK) TaxID=243365 RepID=Q7NVT8_CHRVO|nr:hypothetical protein CV_2254 [Chromobacterium violaceum ATCC 12472]
MNGKGQVPSCSTSSLRFASRALQDGCSMRHSLWSGWFIGMGPIMAEFHAWLQFYSSFAGLDGLREILCLRLFFPLAAPGEINSQYFCLLIVAVLCLRQGGRIDCFITESDC